MFWSKEEFRTVIWHTKITCKITQKVVLPVLVLRVRWKNTIKIEKKIVNKRHYLDLLNEGSRRGGLGQGDGFELVCGSLGGVLALLRTMSLDGFGQSHTSRRLVLRRPSKKGSWERRVKGGTRWGRSEASGGFLQERKLREKSEMMVASSVQHTVGKEGVLWFDGSLGITAALRSG